MPGNPYSSNEPGIGPLMRDIKNKICQDCDLVALLEDDSGMEVRMHECGFLAQMCGDISRQLMCCGLVLDLLFFLFQLLVNNKIISLDLPVAEVYKKVWCPTNEVCVIFIYVYIKSTKHLSLISRTDKSQVGIYFLQGISSYNCSHLFCSIWIDC